MVEGAVLQVEDDENDVLLLRYVFRSLGITRPLYAVGDGEQAIAWLAGEGEYADRARFPIPHLLLLDIKMPRKSGFEVLQWIRARPDLRRLVVVMLSASADQTDVDHAYALGANAYAIKPAGADELGELVTALHCWWFGHNRFGRVGDAG